MAKSIIKEIIIMLLLALAIILVLGVLLYEYVPSNKILPEEISYVTPQNVKEELKTLDGVEEDKVILTYEIDETDLNNYKTVKDYKPGKTNPFSTYEEPKVENSNQNGQNTTSNNAGVTNNNETTGNTNVSNSSSNNSNNSNNSNISSKPTSNTTGYFQDKGTK